MKAVWLSSTYYMDPKLAGCNAAVERMFTRLLAYAGNAETRGFLPENVHKLVGIPSGFRAISELVSRGILEPVEGGGYYFKAWANWNESGDKLLERREKDRERQRKARSKAAPTSRDQSRDVTPLEESREEENSTYVPTNPPVNERARKPRGGREVAERLNATAHSPRAHLAAEKWAKSCNKRPPGELIGEVARIIDGCFESGYEEDEILAGIAAWDASQFTLASKIPGFVHQAVNRDHNVIDIRGKNKPGDIHTDTRPLNRADQKVQDILNLGTRPTGNTAGRDPLKEIPA